MNLQIEHYLQVVKTEVISRRTSWEHKLVEEYEYTAHSSLAQNRHIPVAKFHFELSPMQVCWASNLWKPLNCILSSHPISYILFLLYQVLITENSKSFSHFITNVCAIIGGVFTVRHILSLVPAYICLWICESWIPFLGFSGCRDIGLYVAYHDEIGEESWVRQEFLIEYDNFYCNNKNLNSFLLPDLIKSGDFS